MKPKIGYSYIRFSTPEQAEGDSLRRQLETTAAWCERNGVTLDTQTRLRDLGVSAFSGIHRDNPDKYALAAFLELVRNGKVGPDSYLIVENLDRLTREYLRTAVKLFLDILDHKINIVTTAPERVFRHDSNDMVDIIIAIVELSRGHAESARKSDTVGKAWREKKTNAITGKVALTAMCPHWLKVDDGKYVEQPARVKVVRRIFRETIDGVGVGALCRKLNKEGVKPFREHRRKSDKDKPHQWQKSSLARLLGNRSVFGEYQPHVGSKERRPVGDPVANFYPAVVSESDFYAAEAARKGRKGVCVKAASGGKNLFSGIVKAADGVPFVYHNKGTKQAAYLARSDGMLGGKEYVAVVYSGFERAVLSNLREVTPADLTPADDRREEAEHAAKLQGDLIAVRARKGELVAKMSDPKYTNLDGLLTALGSLETEEKRLVGEYQDARRVLSTPLVEGVTEAQSLIEMMGEKPNDELRKKLRAKIASVVDVMRFSVRKEGVWRIGWVQIHFKHTDYCRNLIFAHRVARRGRGYEVPEQFMMRKVIEVPADDSWFDTVVPDKLLKMNLSPEAFRAEAS